MSTTFGELRIAEAFTFRGARYVKTALSCAEDQRGWGNLFLDETEVEREVNANQVTSGEWRGPSRTGEQGKAVAT